MKRIQPLDGLRAFAVVGVIISHIWGFFGGIPLRIAGVDVNKALSFGGTGVDLFFVISGFCMYLMFENKARTFNLHGYTAFIKKRWFRIAPAFYFAVVVEAVIYYLNTTNVPLKSVGYHFLFINIFNGQNILAPPFWSLATEWHFYLVLPLIFIVDRNRKWLLHRVILLVLASIAFRLWLYYGEIISVKNVVNADEVWYRFPEFAWGIIAAYWYKSGKLNFLQKNKFLYLFGAIIILGLGRLFMTTEFIIKTGDKAFILRAFAEPIMCLGYMMIICVALTGKNFVSTFLSGKIFLFIGRISYSMYLLHWLIITSVTPYMINWLGQSNLNLLLTFFVSMALLIPVSYFSYKYLELPYFKKREEPTIVKTNEKVIEAAL